MTTTSETPRSLACRADVVVVRGALRRVQAPGVDRQSAEGSALAHAVEGFPARAPRRVRHDGASGQRPPRAPLLLPIGPRAAHADADAA
jgi:hypothetical protein